MLAGLSARLLAAQGAAHNERRPHRPGAEDRSRGAAEAVLEVVRVPASEAAARGRNRLQHREGDVPDLDLVKAERFPALNARRGENALVTNFAQIPAEVRRRVDPASG